MAVPVMLAWLAGAVPLSAGTTVQVKLCVVARPKPSVTVSVRAVLAVTADGVPTIAPVAVLRNNPAGRVPLVRATT